MASGIEVAAITLIIMMQVACLLKLIVKLKVVHILQTCWTRLPLTERIAPRKTQDSPQQREIRKESAELLAQRRVDCAKIIVFGSWVATCVLAVPFLVELSAQSAMEDSEQRLFAGLALMLALTLVSVFPTVLEFQCVPNVMHLVCMACMCAFALPQRHTCMMATFSETVSMPALALSALGTRVDIVMFSNLVLTVCQVISSRDSAGGDDVQDSIAHGHVFLYVTRMLIWWCASAVLKWVTRLEVEACFRLRQQSAATALLEMACDAVIDVNGDLGFEQHFPRFAAILMHGPGKHLLGECLLNFVHDQDRTRLATELRKSSTDEACEDPPPSTIKVALRDSNGNAVKSTLLHIPYSSIDGSRRHLVGVREDANGVCVTDQVETSRSVAQELRPDLQEWLSASRNSSLIAGDSSTRTWLSSGSGRSIRSSLSSRLGDEAATLERSAEVFFFTAIPVRWISETLKGELGIPEATSGAEEDRYELGQNLPDSGSSLLAAMMNTVEKQRKRYTSGRFEKCLGEFDFFVQPGQGPSLAADGESCTSLNRRKVWIDFFLPLQKDDDGFPFATIAISSARDTSGGSCRRRGA